MGLPAEGLDTFTDIGGEETSNAEALEDLPAPHLLLTCS